MADPTAGDPLAGDDGIRDTVLDSWEAAAPGWGRQAEAMADAVAPVTDAMLAAAGPGLRPGARVLELAAGPGDLSLRVAPLVAPTRVLCSDGVEAMLTVARERAAEAGVENIEFTRIALEWIDLPAATVDLVLCRYGLMFAVDPGTALAECRRVLVPGGRLVAAVQGPESENPWLTAPHAAAAACGFGTAPSPGPGPFALADADALLEQLADAAFFDATVTRVDHVYRYPNVLGWIGEKLDHSPRFAAIWRDLGDPERARLRAALAETAAPYAAPDGGLAVPGRALVFTAEA